MNEAPDADPLEAIEQQGIHELRHQDARDPERFWKDQLDRLEQLCITDDESTRNKAAQVLDHFAYIVDNEGYGTDPDIEKIFREMSERLVPFEMNWTDTRTKEEQERDFEWLQKRQHEEAGLADRLRECVPDLSRQLMTINAEQPEILVQTVYQLAKDAGILDDIAVDDRIWRIIKAIGILGKTGVISPSQLTMYTKFSATPECFLRDWEHSETKNDEE